MSKYFTLLTLFCFSITTHTTEHRSWLVGFNAGLNHLVWERACNRALRYPCPMMIFSLSAGAGIATMVIGMKRYNSIMTFSGLGIFVGSLLGIICVMQKEQTADQQGGEGQILTTWSATVNFEDGSRSNSGTSETTITPEET